jgi:hypothetical protein
VAISIPAMAGAMMRVPCQIDELRATALSMTDLSTSYGYRDCRAGWLKAFTAPATTAIASTCQG